MVTAQIEREESDSQTTIARFLPYLFILYSKHILRRRSTGILETFPREVTPVEALHRRFP